MEEERRWLQTPLGCVSVQGYAQAGYHVPMPCGSLESESVVLLDALGVCSPLTMVEVEDERLKVLASGARCVSLSSTAGQRGIRGHKKNGHTHSSSISSSWLRRRTWMAGRRPEARVC